MSYPVPGSPRRTIDVAFTRARVAVFVDGCFWHACPEHATWPVNNRARWERKLESNVRRDRETDAMLAEAGWDVVRIWEHEDLEEAVARVHRAVSQRAY